MTSPAYATRPEDFAQVFAENFNRRDIQALVDGYTQDAVLNRGGGKVFRGRPEIRAALTQFRAPGLPIKTAPRAIAVSGSVAIVTMEWAIEGRSPEGRDIAMSAIATGVPRLEADGTWRQLLEMPFGGATEGHTNHD